MYVSTTPKGKTEGVLAFVVPVCQCCMALNGVYRDAGHQGQQRTLALTQERFWWPTMVEDCCMIVKGCPCCQAFKGEVPKAPLCPIRVYAPLELVHLDYTSRVHDGAEQAPGSEKHPRDNQSIHEVCSGGSDEGPDCQDCCKGILRVLHSSFWGTCKTTEQQGCQLYVCPGGGTLVLLSASKSAKPPITMLSAMDRWNAFTRCCST